MAARLLELETIKPDVMRSKSSSDSFAFLRFPLHPGRRPVGSGREIDESEHEGPNSTESNPGLIPLPNLASKGGLYSALLERTKQLADEHESYRGHAGDKTVGQLD